MKKITITVLMTFVFTFIFSAFPSFQKGEKEFSISFLFAAPTADPDCPTCGQCVDCTGAKEAIADAKAKQDAIFNKTKGKGAGMQETLNEEFKDCRNGIMNSIKKMQDGISDFANNASGLAGKVAEGVMGGFKSLFDTLIEEGLNKICTTISELGQKTIDEGLNSASFDLPYGLGSVGAKGIDSEYVESPWELNVGKYGTLTTNSKDVTNSLTEGMIKGGSSALDNAVKGSGSSSGSSSSSGSGLIGY